MIPLSERLTIDEESRVLQPGEVFVKSSENLVNHSGLFYREIRASVGDVSRPEDRARMHDYVDHLDKIIKDHPEWPVPKKGSGEFVSNPVYESFYNLIPDQKSMIFWRDNLVPTASALYPLQRLGDAGRLFPGGVVDDYAMDIFTNHEDGIAIRSRGAVYKDIISRSMDNASGNELTAVALGAGAGVPNIDATVEVRNTSGKEIFWKMYDTSYEALNLARELASEANIPDSTIETMRADYKKAFLLEDNSVDIADMLGLMEYLPRERCVDAMGELYKLLKPGGVMVVSNMLNTRPHIDFYQRGIQWPGVVPRSIDNLVDMVDEAGIDTNNLIVTTTDDNVYAVLEVHKP